MPLSGFNNAEIIRTWLDYFYSTIWTMSKNEFTDGVRLIQ